MGLVVDDDEQMSLLAVLLLAVLYDQNFHFVISIVHQIYEGHSLPQVDPLSFDVCQSMPVIQHSSSNPSICI
jgi:hypothetical protein